MSGFPPATKNTNRNIPDTDQTGATKDVYSKGSGGIPASLKIKNAGVKDASRPTESFTDRMLTQDLGGQKTDSDKTTGYF